MPALTRFETQLRERARELIREGRLPDKAPARVWGGPGSGLPCALCGEIVPANEVEYETEGTAGGAIQVLHFHFVCHAAWQLECLRADLTDRAQSPSGQPPTAPRSAPRSKSSKSERAALFPRRGLTAVLA